jgi:hypothetical protein
MIQPNDPKAIRIDELDSSDISDSLDEMKIRRVNICNIPSLRRRDQAGNCAHNHSYAAVFIFEATHLVEGASNDTVRAGKNTGCARTDSLLAQQDVAVKHTGVFGCSTKWQEKQASRLSALAKIEAQPVKLELVSAAELKTLRANPTGKMLRSTSGPPDVVPACTNSLTSRKRSGCTVCATWNWSPYRPTCQTRKTGS